jgi:hypothetical protein
VKTTQQPFSRDFKSRPLIFYVNRVTRLGEFLPTGLLFLWSSLKLHEWPIFWLLLFDGIWYVLIKTKNGLGCILGDFFTNSSGHPGTLGRLGAFGPEMAAVAPCSPQPNLPWSRQLRSESDFVFQLLRKTNLRGKIPGVGAIIVTSRYYFAWLFDYNTEEGNRYVL